MDFRCPKCGFERKISVVDTTEPLQCPACDAVFPASHSTVQDESVSPEVIDVQAQVLSQENDMPHPDDTILETSEIRDHESQQGMPLRDRTIIFNRHVVVNGGDGCGCNGCGCLTLLLLLLFLLFGI